ncbi:MAG: gfo/Idh/MocA family oxidoreductase [Armatimonadia bacterium]|nr:gfo/Idh/MocA family oxidoreductase [Armatimonadia bacterium]
MSSRKTRREFLKSMAAATAAAPLFLSARAKAQPGPNERLNVAFIGVGGIGGSHRGAMHNMGENGVVLCDADLDRANSGKEQFPNARVYQDYRKMFDAEANNIDAVMVGTPDHHHYPATIIAMQLGKHVYTQKPLTRTVWEARQLAAAAAAHPELQTQMGNQGHAGNHWRVIYEIVNHGLLGDIKEIHTWTNRPVWPQGMDRPQGEDPVPANLDWESWIGPAPMRPFKDGAYHPFVWRGWWDFGAGALGDMACHTMDGTFWSLDPGHPTSVEPLEVNGATAEAFPNSSITRWNFPAKDGRPAFLQYWYDGGLFPEKPEDLPEAEELPNTGNLYIGTEATMVIPGDYGENPSIFADGEPVEIDELPELLPRSPGHFEEWVAACKGQEGIGPQSNFGYAGPMTETILLGCIAQRVNQPLEWDGDTMRFTNVPEANDYIGGEFRDGWAF